MKGTFSLDRLFVFTNMLAYPAVFSCLADWAKYESSSNKKSVDKQTGPRWHGPTYSLPRAFLSFFLSVHLRKIILADFFLAVADSK